MAFSLIDPQGAMSWLATSRGRANTVGFKGANQGTCKSLLCLALFFSGLARVVSLARALLLFVFIASNCTFGIHLITSREFQATRGLINQGFRGLTLSEPNTMEG